MFTFKAFVFLFFSYMCRYTANQCDAAVVYTNIAGFGKLGFPVYLRVYNTRVIKVIYVFRIFDFFSQFILRRVLMPGVVPLLLVRGVLQL